MVYKNNKPEATDLLATSQGDLLGNFAAIDSGTTGLGAGFSRNHVTLTDATNGGLHNRVDYYVAVASPTISGFVSSAYPKNVTYPGPVTYVEEFYKNATSDLPITNTYLSAALGEGMLPGGLQIRSGTGSSNGAGIANTFSKAFPSAVLFVVVTGSNGSQATNKISVTALNNGGGAGAVGVGFTAMSSLGEALYYVAIGY